MANKATISRARDRLGSESMALLFDRVARPLAETGAAGLLPGGRRLVAIDGACLDLVDTPGNDEHYGRPGAMKVERSAFPQARVSPHALIDC